MEQAEAVRAAAEDEGRLVQALRRREPAAHAELCARFGRRLHRFLALRLHGDRQLAEELMVQTLADAARNIGRFDPRRSSLQAWLFGIARRQVLGELRRQQRRKSVPESAQVPIEAVPEESLTEDPSNALAARVAAQRQVAALRAHLSDMEMEALLLHCVHGLSVVEIARVLGRSERAANSLLHRARQKARERLADDA
jgi:RNA polymerase sigma-70 factor (ECF subfamily)